eukprot:m.288784 g.288784  ORF g.288784 m.288784 type:complete len:308 (+) comp55055_c0_seq2:223-1146(+)
MSVSFACRPPHHTSHRTQRPAHATRHIVASHHHRNSPAVPHQPLPPTDAPSARPQIPVSPRHPTRTKPAPAAMTMLSEITCAVDFVLSLLGGRVKDDALHSLRAALTRSLQTKFQKHWYLEDARKGSAYRAITNTGSRTDPLITEVSATCRIPLAELLPRELTLWVDPSEVSYRIGCDGSICHLLTPAVSPASPQRAASSVSPSTTSPSSSRSASPPTVAALASTEPRQFPAYETRRTRVQVAPQQQFQPSASVMQLQQQLQQHQQRLSYSAAPAFSGMYAQQPMYAPAQQSNRFVPAFMQDSLYAY